MANAAFKLQDSGFTREQVEALSDFMVGSVATKEDIANLRADMKEDVAHLEGKILALDGKIEAQGERLEGKIASEIATVKGEIVRLDGKINLVYWMLGILIAGVSSLVIKTFFG